MVSDGNHRGIRENNEDHRNCGDIRLGQDAKRQQHRYLGAIANGGKRVAAAPSARAIPITLSSSSGFFPRNSGSGVMFAETS